MIDEIKKLNLQYHEAQSEQDKNFVRDQMDVLFANDAHNFLKTLC